MYDGHYSAFHDTLPHNSSVLMSATVMPDVHLLMLCIAFAVPYFAFLFVLPGVKDSRSSSFITVSITFVVGFLTLGSILHPGWNSGSARVVTQFHAHSSLRVEASVGAHIGLYNLNITMNHITSVEASEASFQGVNFNEKFDISSVGSMARELQTAYRKGLPYPMLKLLEYFSLNEGSFDWGRKYRLAGHFAGASLWMGFALWILQVVFLCVVPHNYAKVAVSSGTFLLGGTVLYALLCPPQLKIVFTGVDGSTTILEMHYGVCFIAILLAGSLNTLFGSVLCVLQFAKLYTLTTFLSASLDEHVTPSCSKKSNARRAKQISYETCSVTFMKTMKGLRVGPATSPCFVPSSSGFHSPGSSYSSSYPSPSSDEEVFRRSCSTATIESFTRNCDLIVDRF